MENFRGLMAGGFLLTVLLTPVRAAEPDLILHHGKVVTADAQFSLHSAIAIHGNHILKSGSDAEILKLKGARTELVDLKGRMVLPGLIDSHTHPTSAAMTEFDHPIPPMESVQEVLDYVASRAAVVPAGE